MKQFILLISLLSTCYSTDHGVFRLERITWSLPPNGPYGYVEAEYITAPEIDGQVLWYMEATQRRPEAETNPVANGHLLDDVDDTNATVNDGWHEWEHKYQVIIFDNQKHEITSSKWQDGYGVHHSSRINFTPVPVEYGALGVGFAGSGVHHSIWMDTFRPNASEEGSFPGNIEILKKPRNYLRPLGGQVKLHTSIRAKGRLASLFTAKLENVSWYDEVQKSNIEVEDYASDGIYFKSVDVVLSKSMSKSYTSDIEGEYINMISQNTETVQVTSQVLPGDPGIESFYQNDTKLIVAACSPRVTKGNSHEEGIRRFQFDVGWENCIYCVVHGYPNPTAQLFRDETALNRILGPNESITTLLPMKDNVQTILLMEPVDESVAGRYKCVGKADGSKEISQEFIVEVESVA